MKKAYAYLRVSGKGQIDGDGFSRQERTIKRFAKTRGIEIVKTFKDGGVTGTTENRPGLADLMFDLEENGHGIKTVVVEMVNRLARDLMVQEIIVRDFQKHGFELLSATEGEDLLSIDPTRKLVRQVLGAIAEYEKQMLVLKLKAARDRQRRIQGKCEGRKSWKERDPEILAEIKKLRRKRNGRRMSFRKIAGVLNEKGFKNSVGGSFTAKGLSSMWSRNC